MVNKIRDHRDKVILYTKYQRKDLTDFFKRIELKLTCTDPEFYTDSGLQTQLLIKATWPVVRTKQDLVDDGIPCLFYGDSKDKQEKEGIDEVR